MEYPLINRIYKDSKGELYQVYTTMTHIESDEVLVIYKSLSLGTFFAIPLQSWSKITNNGSKNFELVS
jgi:hypothetical protein